MGHLVGHEGRGSILSSLKAKGWCDDLSAGYNTSAEGFGFFYVKANLTEEGIEKIDEIITMVFQVRIIGNIFTRYKHEKPKSENF